MEPTRTSSSSFIPCLEDAEGCRRHPNAAQDALCQMNRRILAQVHLRLLASRKRERSDPASADPEEGGAPPESRAPWWGQQYAKLWTSQNGVPEYLRREWLETAMTCASNMTVPPASRGGGMVVAFDWLFSAPLFFQPDNVAAAYADLEKEQEQHSEAAAAAQDAGKKKKKPKRRRKWVLWEDPSRGQNGIHHLTIPTATRGALRPLDVSRLEGTAFVNRVHAWLGVVSFAAVVTHNAGSPSSHSIPLLPPQPPATCQDLDDIKLFHLLSVAVQRETMSGAASRQLRGAVRYRMLLEMTCCRLRDKPRCLPTWRLLADALAIILSGAETIADMASIDNNGSEGGSKDQTVAFPVPARTLVGALQQYITRFIVPYLEMRERYVSVLHNAFTHTLREELSRVAGGQGAWGTTIREVGGPVLVEKWAGASAEARARVLVRALQEVCDFTDEAPALGVEAAVDHAAVLAYAPAGQDGSHELAEPSALFESSASRRRCLMEFVSRHLLASPLESFDRAERTAPSDTHHGD